MWSYLEERRCTTDWLIPDDLHSLLSLIDPFENSTCLNSTPDHMEGILNTRNTFLESTTLDSGRLLEWLTVARFVLFKILFRSILLQKHHVSPCMLILLKNKTIFSCVLAVHYLFLLNRESNIVVIHVSKYFQISYNARMSICGVYF